MNVRIQRNQIRHFTVGGNDILQIDVQFPEYPDLPTYGMRIDFPITKQKVIDAVTWKAQEVSAQVQKDEVVRELLGQDVLEFNVEVN